jgi:1-acyl-sn-glycerol-3-phosphate acyltransferase
MHIHEPKGWRQRFGTTLLGLFGWKAVLELPPGKKFVAIGYPHTSNWDFIPLIGWAWATGMKASFVGKQSLFKGLMGPIMRRLGGIPLDRDKSKNFVQKVAEIITDRDEIFLVVAPEGTRSRADHWKSGFYYMALEAKVPIALGLIDWKRKLIGMGAYVMPTGDLDKDFEAIKAFYKDVVGRDLSKQGPVALKPPEPTPS